VVKTLLRSGYEFLTIGRLVQRLSEGGLKGKFVSITFDDGFADNFLHAFPVCREFNVPMTLYLVSGFLRREFPMWSFGLEATLAANDSVKFEWDGHEFALPTATPVQKRRAYATISSRFVRAHPERILDACRSIGYRCGVDFMALTDKYALSPEMVRTMHNSGLVEFGAHSVRHAYLGRLDDEAARDEIERSKRECEAVVEAPVVHFAYPYGDRFAAGEREAQFCRDVGFQSAVTTECDTISEADRDRLWNLPRLSYNGDFQDTPLLELLMSGTLPALRAVHSSLRDCLPGRLSSASSVAPARPPGARSIAGS
jgi:peptidoglycan/xylan/chitin deacetylase (PgdA/CDA1 family)